jgi:hypothetical protein
MLSMPRNTNLEGDNILEPVSDYQKTTYDRQDYGEFLGSIQAHFDTFDGPLFTTDASGLFTEFLNHFQAGEIRQHYTCHACRKFVETFGGLVSITPDGYTVPAMWPGIVPEFYRSAVKACYRIVSKAKVTGVFLDPREVWGQPMTGVWQHMHVELSGAGFREITKTAHQVMAEKRQEYALISRSLNKYDARTIDQAIALLETESLSREEKSLSSARWFRDLIDKRNNYHGKRRRNVVWLAVATAPPGWAHIKNNMFGTLLQDLDDGYSFAHIQRRFADKMDPLRYQRPQVAPKRGNILQANKIVEKLQSAGALQRKFATFEEIRDRMFWLPNDVHEERGRIDGDGPFDRLLYEKRKLSTPVAVKNITWIKFRDTVLDKATAIQFHATRRRDNYSAITTCADPTAPPILQWDFEDNRNPFAQYVYHGGSIPSRWNLSSNSWINVLGVCYQPSQWTSGLEHHGQSVIFILENCRDKKITELAIFPETLKAEYHEIRSTIERYSRTGRIQDTDGQLASGIRVSKCAVGFKFRVYTDNLTIDYNIDRWD